MKCAVTLAAALLSLASYSAAQSKRTGPLLLSVFPLAVQKGTPVDVRVHGADLAGTYAVWFDCGDLTAVVKDIRENAGGEASNATASRSERRQQEVLLSVRVNPQAIIGRHAFRLVSHKGVSDPLSISVVSETTTSESELSHHEALSGQRVIFPAVINGQISRKGEVDYYSFDVSDGQELCFEVATANGLGSGPLTIFNEPSLNVYELSGSWFDPRRATRLQAEDVSSFFYYPETEPRMFHFIPRLTQRFSKPGRYSVGVGSTDGQGGTDYSYMLRIIPAPASSGWRKSDWTSSILSSPDPLGWQERDFLRHIRADRFDAILSRSAPDSNPGVPADGLKSVHEGDSVFFRVPAVVEGVTGQADDEDHFRFEVSAGERLAFEIETPEQRPPYYSPRLSVVDGDGRELFSNVYRKIDGNGVDWTKSIEPKTVYKFDRAGAYTLRIRDLTTQRGGPNFAYRVLVRRQVPHVGEIAFKTFPVKGAGNERYEDRLNVAAGESRAITVVSDLEEGFDGHVVIGAESLPPGITLQPAIAAPVEVYSKGAQGQGLELFANLGAPNKELYRPKRLTATLILTAAADCPETRMPMIIRFTAQPVANGVAGMRFPFQELPLMIVQPQVDRNPVGLEERKASRPAR